MMCIGGEGCYMVCISGLWLVRLLAHRHRWALGPVAVVRGGSLSPWFWLGGGVGGTDLDLKPAADRTHCIIDCIVPGESESSEIGVAYGGSSDMIMAFTFTFTYIYNLYILCIIFLYNYICIWM